MTATNLKNKIIKLGGKITKFDGEALEAELNGYDINKMKGTSRFFTARRISNRGYYDAGSDYNPSGSQFHYRVKDLETL